MGLGERIWDASVEGRYLRVLELTRCGYGKLPHLRQNHYRRNEGITTATRLKKKITALHDGLQDYKNRNRPSDFVDAFLNLHPDPPGRVLAESGKKFWQPTGCGHKFALWQPPPTSSAKPGRLSTAERGNLDVQLCLSRFSSIGIFSC